MQESRIIVPLRIEGLCLKTLRQAAPPLGDYSRLPWSDSSTDFFFEQPFVSRGIVHAPFANPGFPLHPGMHLHFIVPHFLGRPGPNNLQTHPGTYPAAPNRWLVARNGGGLAEQQWLIESDFVHAEEVDPDEPVCVIPHAGAKQRPYRYMGRKTAYGHPGTQPGDSFKKLNNGKPLTVLGYGGINFSSFYPNCAGVFGFYDPEGQAGDDLKYSVIGWNSEQEDDLLRTIIPELTSSDTSMSREKLNGKLRNLFKLQLEVPDAEPWPLRKFRTLFFGEIQADASPPTERSKLQVSVGNTGTEALSALLADKMSNGKPERSTHKNLFESQLESILLHSGLEHHTIDVGPKFHEARHRQGFRAVTAGQLWKITTHHPDHIDAPAADQPELPSELAGPLQSLNMAQMMFDRSERKLITLRHQLYADWYRYMHARYPGIEGRGVFPDADHIQYFIETHSFAELEATIESTGIINGYDETNNFRPRIDKTGKADRANAVLNAWQRVSDLISLENERRRHHKASSFLALTMIDGPRYWEPRAPVLMIAGLDPANAESDGPPGDQYLTCPIIAFVGEADPVPADIADLREKVRHRIQPSQLSQQAWNPFLLDWEMDLVDTDLRHAGGAFEPDGLKRNVALAERGPDFEQRPEYVAGRLSVFSGSVIMSSHARQSLRRHIRSLIEISLKKDHIKFTDHHGIDDFLRARSEDVPALLHPDVLWEADPTRNPLETARLAYQKLDEMHVVSQTLNGFHHACIMLKKVAQLPVEEPIGFAAAKAFTGQVRELVANRRDSSPLPAFDFNPIRSGGLKLNRLRLIDNFGLIHDIDPTVTGLVAAETLRDGSKRDKPFLPPRLSQPARLNFRWLSAHPVSADVDEYADHVDFHTTNDHPDTSPVCGWLMADYLDNSVAVFSAAGTALGSIKADGTWDTPPWSERAPDLAGDITNPYLFNTVSRLTGSKTFLEAFLSATQNALEHIAPTNAHLFDTKWILMGRPMAVVRATISFELCGLPAMDQSWPALLADLHNCDAGAPWTYAKRYRRNWTAVKFPIRLGEHAQLNDGLVGYWIEDAYGGLGDPFFAPETSAIAGEDPRIDATGHQTRWRSPDDAPLNVTMLVDPRGVVHATTGLLPTKVISIPASHYLPVLRKFGLWFRTTPLLQPAPLPNAVAPGPLVLNTPAVSGFRWQWFDPRYGVRDLRTDDEKEHNHLESELVGGWLLLTQDRQ